MLNREILKRIRSFAWAFVAGLLLLPLLATVGCGVDSALLADDLEAAREAYASRNLPLAERLLERYLRSEQNPEKRWEAWNLLLQAINAESQESRASLECLQAMHAEYENDEERLAFILSQMGKHNALLRHYDDAARAWSAWLELGDSDEKDRVEAHRQLARMQFAQRHFDAGEETLQQCLALPVADHDKIMCLLDLAYENMSRERWQEVADLCRQIEDSEPDETVSGLAGYLLGDALEQMGKENNALEIFEKYRNFYPNPAVMDNRIEFLRKNIKIKKELTRKAESR